MLDHYHAERLGARYKDQSTTEIETSSHGSEVCNCRVQRVFFLSRQLLSAGSRNYCGFAAHNCSFATKKNPLAPRVRSNEETNPNCSSFSFFIYSFPTQQDCVLPVAEPKCPLESLSGSHEKLSGSRRF